MATITKKENGILRIRYLAPSPKKIMLKPTSTKRRSPSPKRRKSPKKVSLTQIGYSTTKSENLRRDILKKSIKTYNKKQIILLLKTLEKNQSKNINVVSKIKSDLKFLYDL